MSLALLSLCLCFCLYVCLCLSLSRHQNNQFNGKMAETNVHLIIVQCTITIAIKFINLPDFLGESVHVLQFAVQLTVQSVHAGIRSKHCEQNYTLKIVNILEYYHCQVSTLKLDLF